MLSRHVPHQRKDPLWPLRKAKTSCSKSTSTGAGAFTTVAGLRSRSLAFNSERVDITHADSAGQWRELLEGAGAKSARISGSGIFKDTASDATIRAYAFNGTIRRWQVVVPDFGVIDGPFQIQSFDLSGRHDGEVGFEITLEFAGELLFTAI